MQEIKFLPKDTEVICPACERIMVIAKHDIYPGMIFGIENFTLVEFEGPSGALSKCPIDDTVFAHGEKVYTREGWK